jgi:hypothetical protein
MQYWLCTMYGYSVHSTNRSHSAAVEVRHGWNTMTLSCKAPDLASVVMREWGERNLIINDLIYLRKKILTLKS